MEYQPKHILLQYITHWPELNINYWAIHKNATSSIMAHLVSITSDIDVAEFNRSDDMQAKHIVREQQRYIDKNDALTNGCKNLTVVRDPFDRLESCYKMFKHPLNETHKVGASKAGFKVDWNEEDFLNYIELHFTKNLRGNKHFAKQISFIHNADNMDYIVKLEQLNEQWPLEDKPTFTLNKTTNQTTSLDRQRVRDLYEEDYRIFGY